MKAKLQSAYDNARIQTLLFMDKRWSRVAPIMAAGISRAAVSITVTGTALLWSNSFENTAAGVRETLKKLGIVIEPGGFDTGTRLKLIYYGGVALLVSWVIYKLRCPEVLQRQPVAEDYLAEQTQVRDPINLERSMALASTFALRNPDLWSTTAPSNVGRYMTPTALISALNDRNQEGSKSIIFRACHLQAQVQRPYAFWFCVIIGAVGLFMTLLPPLEVFLRVTWRLLK